MPTFREIARRHGSDIDTMALLRQMSTEESPPLEQPHLYLRLLPTVAEKRTLGAS
jgi:hypothetical protein